MEACHGTKKDIDITHMVKCPQCSGTGADANTVKQTCTECNGQGSVKVNQRTPFGVISSSKVCSKCGGKGQIITNPCSKCRGAGRIRKTEKINITIPAGINEGQTMRLAGKGDAGINGGLAGDLYAEIRVKSHDLFTRKGNDIYCDIPLTYMQAALGDEITIPTIDGNISYSIPEGTQSGTKFQLRGKGVKVVNRDAHGDQYFTVTVEVPKKLNKKQRELLKAFDDSLDEKNHSRKDSFLNRLKKKLDN